MIAAHAHVVASGLRFPEGPVALGDGAIACVEMQGGAITRVSADGATSVIAELGGAPNGAALGQDGALYVANNGGLSVDDDGGYWRAPVQIDGCLQRVDPRGVSVVGQLPGAAPHRPNDVCVAADGSLVLTDSANWEDMRNLAPGRIVRVQPNGETALLAELPAMPNGIAFSPDGRELLVAQSLTRRIWAYPWDAAAVADGAPLGAPRELCRLPSGSPDGMCVATDGRLFVCGSIGDVVFVLDADGAVLDTVATGAGSQPTNCCLADGRLYVTLAKRGQLVAFDTDAAPAMAAAGALGAWGAS